MTEGTPTHAPRPTCSREEAGEPARALVLEIRDLLRNEELWHVARAHLDAAYQRGYRQGELDERDEE